MKVISWVMTLIGFILVLSLAPAQDQPQETNPPQQGIIFQETPSESSLKVISPELEKNSTNKYFIIQPEINLPDQD